MDLGLAVAGSVLAVAGSLIAVRPERRTGSVGFIRPPDIIDLLAFVLLFAGLMIIAASIL